MCIVIRIIYVLFTAAVGVLFLGDPVTWRFWAGGSAIVICIIAMNLLQTGKGARNMASFNSAKPCSGP